MTLPTLAVVSGPPGSGKTTLAHELARAVGCPAICRDELKEGLVHANPSFTPEQENPFNLRTNAAFFATLELLLRHGVSVVAEAAFQDRLWRPGLTPLLRLAQVRVVHCTTAPEVAYARIVQRAGENAHRHAAHADRSYVTERRHQTTFDAVRLVGVPELRVDTTTGYAPGLDAIAAFVSR